MLAIAGIPSVVGIAILASAFAPVAVDVLGLGMFPLWSHDVRSAA